MADIDSNDIKTLTASVDKVTKQLGDTTKSLASLNTSLQAGTKAAQNAAKPGAGQSQTSQAVATAAAGIKDGLSKDLLAALDGSGSLAKAGQDLAQQFLRGTANTATASLGDAAARSTVGDPTLAAFLKAFGSAGQPAAKAPAAGAATGQPTTGAAAGTTADATQGQDDAAKNVGFMVELANDAGTQIRKSLGDVLFNTLDGNFKAVGKSFQTMLQQMLADVAASQISKLAGSALGWIGSAIGGLFGGGGFTSLGGGEGVLEGGTYLGAGSTAIAWPGSGYASGGAFQSGSEIHAFANGGVVGSPTLFPMARGTGLMGEAGPEAIMPLARGSDGKLGVRGAGAGGGVNNQISISVNVASDGAADDSGSQSQSSDAGRQLAALIEGKGKDVMVREQRQGGILWRMQHA